MEENAGKAAAKILAKYMRKGNLTRCMRDILPAAGLRDAERERASELVHDAIRWRRLYDALLDERCMEKSADNYVALASEGAQSAGGRFSFEIMHSCSKYIARILEKHPGWAVRLNGRPPTTLCVNFNRAAHREVMDSLISEGLPANASALETAVVTSSSGKYSSIVKTGMAHVQDEASQLVSHIAAGLGQSILDFCAGNGGKTLALASITRNSKSLHAMDASPERMDVLEARCREYGAKVDIMTPVHKTFDVVLVDAPCSGAGAGRRNPEAKYVAGPIGFPEVQFKILREASKRVAGNGFIIYSVCTFTPEETGDTVEKFLKAGGFRAVHFDELPFRELLEEAAFGAFTNVPGGDIFYVSVMKKET